MCTPNIARNSKDKGLKMYNIPEDIQQAIINDAEKKLGVKPRIIVSGKTGSGKSSLINALLELEVNATGASEPVTQEEQVSAWTLPGGELTIIDVPGFGEADKHNERVQFILDQLTSCHVMLLVVGAPDRAWEHERQFVEIVHNTDPDFPLLVVGNRIDMFNPVREWNPTALNLIHPSTKKEQSIVAWSESLRESLGIEPQQMVLTCAGEAFSDFEGRYGLDNLGHAVVDALPLAVQNAAARALRVNMDKKALCEKIIWRAAVASAGVALVPIPLADAIPLAAIQVGMIIKIAEVYGKILTPQTAITLLAPVAASFLGRTAVQNLLKFIPGLGTVLGTVIGASIAGPLTYAVGKTYMEFFASKNFTPTPEEVRELLKKKYKQAQERSKDLEAEARREREK